MTKDELRVKIQKKEIDVNLQSIFFSKVIKGLLSQLNQEVKIRGKMVPHIILNTGDDTMWLEKKGQDNSVEPYEVSNEEGVYGMIPRCVVDMGSMEVLEDQLTNPYTRGDFEIERDGEMWSLSSEFRRMPIKITVTLKYYMDTFGDTMELMQNIIANLLFIKTYKVDYMGQSIMVSYKVPSSLSAEKNITFDGGTTEQKTRTVSLDLELESNCPILEPRTVVVNGMGIISKTEVGIKIIEEEKL